MTDITKRLAEALAESTYALERALAGQRIVNADETIEHGKQVLRAYDAQTGKAGGWQSIETAPKDGQRVLLDCTKSATCCARYVNGVWIVAETPIDVIFAIGARAWMPIPDPPEQSI